MIRAAAKTPGVRKLLVLLLAVAAALSVPSQAAPGGSADDLRILRVEEYRLKAEFLERFTHFVKWPPKNDKHEAEKPPPPPFVLCVIGSDPFGDSLRRLARTRKVDDRPIELRQLRNAADAPSCQLLFISASERERLDQVLAAARGNGVLTVGDTDGYGARGVLINLFVADDKIGFEVNERAAKREGFELSARLLKLARLVE
jgi:hypothetical protein